LYSNPRNISNELLANVANEKRVKGEDLEFFPLQMIEGKLANKEEFVVAIVQITNVDIIESNCSLDGEYLIASQIRKRLLKILDADDLLIQYFLGTFLLTKTITRYNYQNAISSIEKVFEKPFEIREKQFPIIVRIGVSSLSRKVRNSRLLLRQTKMAIAALSHFGRNGTLSYDKEIDDYLLRYYSILESLPNAIKEGEIEVFFQPIIEIATSKIVSCEALSRWNHPKLKEVSPSEFIPIVEKNGHERALGVYVFQQAAAFLNELDSLQQGSISVSINTCPSELQDVNLIPHFVKTLTQYNIKHDRIIVELTERTLLTDVDVAKKVLGGLRKERIRVAIDDFGVGFSSLSYLHDLEIDLLKIDRSFIKDYPKEDDGVIIKAMVGMAREFKVPVLVEGVETEEQLEFIKSLGVQYYQGFYFSEALNQKDFIELFKKNS
ncbi:MAG: EAL domain-containing protein, partial [Sphaerochaetaceae bacterium]